MPNDYMDAAGGDAPADNAPEKDAEEQGGDNTALLAKSFFGEKPVEVGAKLCVKVVAIHGDEIEVEADTEKESKPDKQDEGDSSEMAGVMSKMDAMAK
jgi:hypothetical protein